MLFLSVQLTLHWGRCGEGGCLPRMGVPAGREKTAAHYACPCHTVHIPSQAGGSHGEWVTLHSKESWPRPGVVGTPRPPGCSKCWLSSRAKGSFAGVWVPAGVCCGGARGPGGKKRDQATASFGEVGWESVSGYLLATGKNADGVGLGPKGWSHRGIVPRLGCECLFGRIY